MEGDVTSKSQEIIGDPLIEALDAIDLGPEKDIESFKFEPPLYKQRYAKVASIIEEYFGQKECKLLEFGCAELKVFKYYKSLPCVQKITFVDIDEDLLEFNKKFVAPFVTDYLPCFKRERPLKVSVFAGDISNPDPYLKDHNAVVGIEVIEHLVDSVLDAAVRVIFGCIRPDLVIFTTPNCEFNVNFPDLKGFRHYDHKFEWTRAQFEAWSANIGSVYGYSCQFSGVGEGQGGCLDQGYCSQIAIYERQSHLDCECIAYCPSKAYKLLAEHIYPAKDNPSRAEDILYETNYMIMLLARKKEEFFYGDEVDIYVKDILEGHKLKEMEAFEPEIRTAIEKLNFPLKLNSEGFAYVQLRNQPDDSNLSDDDTEQNEL